MAKAKHPGRTPEQWQELWVSSKTENPLLTRDKFAEDQDIGRRNMSKWLRGLEDSDRETLSRYIAQRIEECAINLGKDPCDLVWYEFKGWEGIRRGSNGTITPHHITAAGGWNAIRAAYFPVDPTKQQVERRVVQTHALYNRRLGETLAQNQWKSESLESFAERIYKGRINAPKWKAPKLKTTKRIVNTVWSDLHFGSNIKAAETGGFDYGCTEEARSMAHIVAEVADYKPQYRDTTTLRIKLIGDIMQGHLHPGDAAAHAEQMSRCMHILSQAIGYLAGCYSMVEVDCASGNHGRNKQKHFDRATDQKWDSHETVIYTAIKMMLAKLTNVRVHIPFTPYVLSEAFGVGTFATHGDTVMNTGYGGKNVPTGSILTQINQMNQDWSDNARERGLEHVPCMVFVSGHTHAPVIHHATGGRTLIVNGSLPTADGFTNSLGRFATANGQWIWEQVDGFPVGDTRFVRVGFGQHKDASLDKIISPWSAL